DSYRVHVDDLHHRDRVLHEWRVRGEVPAEIAHAARSEIFDRRLDSGEVLLPDRHPGRLEDVAIALLALAQTVKDRQAGQRILEAAADLQEQELLSRCPRARVRALAGAEDVRQLTLRVERQHHPGWDTAALRQFGRQ